MGQSGAGEVGADAGGLRIAIVAARYNESIVEQMLSGASRRWLALGGDALALRIERVPGAFELPLAARQFALSGKVDAVVVLGCVIRGETAHFEYVAGECARGVQQVTLETGVPVSFGVLTTENEAQAQRRAAPGELDKGGEAIEAAVAMVRLLRNI
jgi:6,7-dimethyl-8-ribityllumazine synthase